MLIALARPDEAAIELEKIVEPRDAEAPRYLFALGVAHLRAGRKPRPSSGRWKPGSSRCNSVRMNWPQLSIASSRRLK